MASGDRASRREMMERFSIQINGDERPKIPDLPGIIVELKMTLANDQEPEPPRHCQEDMDLMAPID